MPTKSCRRSLPRRSRRCSRAASPRLRSMRCPSTTSIRGRSKPRLWANDYVQPRLYDRRRVRFKDSMLHDSLDTAGMKVGVLKGDVHHFSSRSFDDQLQKAVERARYNADHAKAKSAGILRFRLVFEFPASFLRYYLMRRHFTGGLTGFQSSMIGAFSRFARIARMLEAAERPQTQRADAFNERPRAMILIATQCFPPDRGGIEMLMGGLADALSRARRSESSSLPTACTRRRPSAAPYPITRFGGFKPLTAAVEGAAPSRGSASGAREGRIRRFVEERRDAGQRSACRSRCWRTAWSFRRTRRRASARASPGRWPRRAASSRIRPTRRRRRSPISTTASARLRVDQSADRAATRTDGRSVERRSRRSIAGREARAVDAGAA